MLTRRGFLRAGIAGTLLVGGAAVVGRSLSGYHLDATLAGRLRVLSPKEYLVMQAVARRVLAADGDDAPSPDSVDVAGAVDAYVAKLPSAVQRDVRGLLQLVEHGSSLFRGQVARFTHMAAAEQDATLADWQRSSLTVRRRGFQALRTLAFVGYWRDDRTWPLIGYSGPMLPT
ncbi:MAG: gluconate 2-dehydrogenase subunit 3 family protein, partial [Myxococcales bacterium]|nr:gluconate 2-dehydrogenase subunit 3 family protein [Myxococcales bacterium]